MLNKNTIFLGLLLFIPVSIAAHFLGWGESIVFITAGIGIVPLAAYMGEATGKLVSDLSRLIRDRRVVRKALLYIQVVGALLFLAKQIVDLVS